MGAPRTTPQVLDALNKKRGHTVTVADLTASTGLNAEQIQSAVKRLISRNGLPITEVVKANAWRYEREDAAQGKEPADSLFEVVGEAAKGDIIVRGDVTGKLFKVLPL